MPKLAHFGCIAAISCHEGVFLPLGFFWECIRVIFCQEFAPPSSARSAPRGCFIQRARLRLSEMSLENASSRNVALRLFGNALQRCFVRGPSSAQSNERWLLRCSAHVGLPLRCRGALGDAVLRSFGCWMSSLMRMAAERAEHGRVQVQVRVRVRMPLLPRRCRVLAGDSDYRVLHGVDVLGHCVKRGVGERLGNHVNQGFGGRRHRGVSSLRALTAAMRIARKRNRSPQNGAGRDDGSSQRSLL